MSNYLKNEDEQDQDLKFHHHEVDHREEKVPILLKLFWVLLISWCFYYFFKFVIPAFEN